MVYRLLCGAESMGYWMTVFWFISVLWLSSIFYNLLQSYNWSYWFWPLLIIGYVLGAGCIKLPYGLNIVPMATIYIFIGNKARYWILDNLKLLEKYSSVIVLFLISIMLFFVMYMFQEELSLDMKHGYYGLPIISLGTSVALSLICLIISYYIAKFYLISYIFCYLGQASLIIMFLHMPIRLFISRFYKVDSFTMLVGSIIISLISYYFIDRSKFLRFIFMGEKH